MCMINNLAIATTTTIVKFVFDIVLAVVMQ